jgi:Flp pilus assembly pilin Flp
MCAAELSWRRQPHAGIAHPQRSAQDHQTMIHPLLSVSAAALRDALKNRKGVTAAEYAILAVGLVVAVGAAVTAFGPVLTGKLTSIFNAPA